MIFFVAMNEKKISDWMDGMSGKDKDHHAREFARSCRMRHGDRRGLSVEGRRDGGRGSSLDDGDGNAFAMAAAALEEDQNDL